MARKTRKLMSLIIPGSPHRALAFAHDVELRLIPWYGRPRTGLFVDGPNLAASTAVNAVSTAALTGGNQEAPAAAAAAWRGGTSASASNSACGDGGGGGRDDGRGGEKKHRHEESGGASFSTKKQADLLACGCVLAEMCAGEPVLAGPSSSSEGTSGGGGDGRNNWLKAAVELPPALRSTIRALTHADPGKVGVCVGGGFPV